MPYAVVLDACVLHPAHLRDTLLRLSERELFQPLWTSDILAELERSLTKREVSPQSARRLVETMESAFESAMVRGFEPLVDSMTCEPKDRHVLAAAVHGDAGAIITFNVRDFPQESLQPHSIDVIHPDDFLLDALDLAPSTVIEELRQQADANRVSPRTLFEILDALATAGSPRFADEIRRRL